MKTQADAEVAHERLTSAEGLMRQLEMDRGTFMTQASGLALKEAALEAELEAASSRAQVSQGEGQACRDQWIDVMGISPSAKLIERCKRWCGRPRS